MQKKLSHRFLLHFPIGMDSYDHQAKYQGVFPWLLENTFFIKVPPLNSFKFSLSKADILCGGHRNPYQLKNAIKSDGTVFLHISLGLNSLSGSCVHIPVANLIFRSLVSHPTMVNCGSSALSTPTTGSSRQYITTSETV